MKKYLFPLFLSVAVLTMLIIGGCSKNSPTDPDNTEVGELDKAYGGYTTADEPPAFGDPDIAEEFGEDEDVDDPVTDNPNFMNLVNSDSVNAYFIHITWGLLEFDSTASEVVNWDGSASVNKGVLGIMRTIRFERGDRILLPRPDLATLEWTSNTIMHLDGISLVILDDDSTDIEGEFTISTPLYNRTFSFSELDSLELVETVSPSGHQVSVVAHNKKVIPFGGGFLQGRWIKTGENRGKFHGKWINHLGTHAGHLQGIWGINNQGIKVFHGKYIHFNGEFGGLISGLWGFAENDENIGWLRGRWVNRSLTKIGEIRGHWKTHPDNDRHGFFHGNWRRTRP